MFQDISGRSECRQDVDEPEHLGFENRITHRPFHQASMKILTSKKAPSSTVAVDEVKNLPAQLLNLQLNRPRGAHEAEYRSTGVQELQNTKEATFKSF